MKLSIIFSIAISALALTSPSLSFAADGPIGYAAGTTGGQGGQTVTVSTLSALQSAASSSSSMIIQVSGVIRGSGSDRIWVKSNKTIVGLPGAAIIGAGLSIYNVKNIIVQNLSISMIVGGDAITIKEGASYIWIDHCEFFDDRDHGWDYYDGLVDITQQSDYVTVSWSKFHDSHIAVLIGGGYDATDDIGHLRVTLHHNSFTNISERIPDAKFGNIHLFNNHVTSSTYMGAFMGATMRVENNYFKSSNLPIRTDLSPTPGVISGLSTNIFDSCGANRITSAASNWIPPYEYQSVLTPVADVPSVVAKGAGPGGVVSPQPNPAPTVSPKPAPVPTASPKPTPAPTISPKPAPTPAPTSAACATGEISGSVDVAQLATDGGYAWMGSLALSSPSDTPSAPSASTVRLFENGREIGPAHAAHQEIRDSGAGRFSHWSNKLRLSASDNSNPKTNGRKYTYCAKGSLLTTNPTPSSTPAPSATPVSLCAAGEKSGVIDAAAASSEGGYAWVIWKTFPGTPDSLNQGETRASTLRILENGREIGPAHSLHRDIREIGKGRFSHRADGLRFSSSDNSNPRTNGRKYNYCMK